MLTLGFLVMLATFFVAGYFSLTFSSYAVAQGWFGKEIFPISLLFIALIAANLGYFVANISVPQSAGVLYHVATIVP
jgi:hypothetical protein